LGGQGRSDGRFKANEIQGKNAGNKGREKHQIKAPWVDPPRTRGTYARCLKFLTCTGGNVDSGQANPLAKRIGLPKKNGKDRKISPGLKSQVERLKRPEKN